MRNIILGVASVLKFLRVDVGALAETKRIVKGAHKLENADEKKFKSRATAAQTRRLAEHVRCVYGDGDVADAFLVARQFCLRFHSEVIGLGGRGHSIVITEVVDGVKRAGVRFRERKGHDPADEPVHWRDCVCAKQGPWCHLRVGAVLWVRARKGRSCVLSAVSTRGGRAKECRSSRACGTGRPRPC